MGLRYVAPLTGSVDRNICVSSVVLFYKIVAPLTGSVDRNSGRDPFGLDVSQSLPSRGAWIEMGSIW